MLKLKLKLILFSHFTQGTGEVVHGAQYMQEVYGLGQTD